MKQKSGERTLLASVLLSAPGPIVLGVGLFLGRSSTQYADFTRRCAELAAIIVSFAIYRALHRAGEPDPARRERLERAANLCVGAAMCVSGAAMVLLALFFHQAQTGNVLLSLIIAVLGATTNTWFWLRYRSLNRERPDAILAAQARLYRAKSLVDACVTAALLVVAIAPGSAASHYMDVGGTLAVSVYLVATGVMTVAPLLRPRARTDAA